MNTASTAARMRHPRFTLAQCCKHSQLKAKFSIFLNLNTLVLITPVIMAGARDTFWRKCSFFAASHSWVGHYTRGHVEKSGNYTGPLYMTIIGPIHCPDTAPAHQLMHSYRRWRRITIENRENSFTVLSFNLPLIVCEADLYILMLFVR